MRRSRSKPQLTVTVQRRAGRIVEVLVGGHSRLAAAGEDIVCAGVSALVQSAAYGVVRHAGANAVVRDEPEGDYVLEILEPDNARAQAVLETAVSGLRAIAREYPKELRVLSRTGVPRTRAEHHRPRKGV
ncbi:MAG: ribosomal-processing cysteine protease Prp [Candidatus Eremiobacteraeota bacterium]|nr:ribosomal-processing cysteine protease Prp [Candidatus Eremiobacteraeota bacterium]MBV8365735.1 ribosomal-processing cysteine protease Prp [Candidatus Eremiobacteraeota bacterium]